MMNVEVVPSGVFLRKAKRLAKKYPSFAKDLRKLEDSLKENPKQGADLGQGLRKVRMSIESKGAGKSGGARVIAHEAVISVERELVTMLTIYDKSEQATVTDKEIKDLLKSVFAREN